MAESRTLGETVQRRNAWGIDLNYQDAFDRWHDASDTTVAALLQAMGVSEQERRLPPARDDSLIVLRKGVLRNLSRPASVVLENGETIAVRDRLPPDLPTGYHHLQSKDGDPPVRLIVSPGECFLPKALKTWGWAVQLYAARSRDSWGIGDFAALDRLAAWSAEQLGAGMLLLNPLSAVTPITPQQCSPYYPSSRRFFNPLAIHIEWVPGATGGLIPDLETIAHAGRALNSQRLIDRDQIFRLKMQALELLWNRFPADESFSNFCAQQGADLDHFAAFCVLAERFQSGWHTWPEEYRHPLNPAVASFARQNSRRLAFHKWLQWLSDGQLARCSRRLSLMQDLPVGIDPDGADGWAWQDVLAPAVSVGAPPDEFNTSGQNWGLPPFIPHRLRAAGYQPFVQTLRAAFRHGGGLRIDHVMGLFRLFWIPQGMSAAEGTYVRYNADEMLAIVAIESQRARAYVVGEDLGTVEDDIRTKLAQHKILSYRLLWFEKTAPAEYPAEALAAITTHDLPTVAGLWTGSDLRKQQDLALNPNEESTAEIHARLARVTSAQPDTPLHDVIANAYSVLAQAPSFILSAALEDAAAVEERPNMPATMSDKHPNWSIALPVPLEDLIASPLPARIAAGLRRAHGASEE